MSHFTKIKTKLSDRTTIEKSLSDLNIQWESETTKVRGYKGQQHEAEIIIRQKIIMI
jgi:galactitol-specific phosphotransferase system IIB component